MATTFLLSLFKPAMSTPKSALGHFPIEYLQPKVTKSFLGTEN
ncbi:MAG: hypothetical protein WCY19_00935 [Candidatus Gastranaerophilaceae bacterium]